MELKRIFTTGKTDPFDLFKWSKRTSEIRNLDGSSAFIQEDIEVPESWSQLATDIVVSKYFRRAGVPDKTEKVPEEGIPERFYRSIATNDAEFGGETSVRQCIHRIVGHWTYWNLKSGLLDENNANIFYDEMVYMMLNQMISPNSPQWFNSGLGWAYGIHCVGKNEYYAFDLHGNLLNTKEQQEETICKSAAHACLEGSTLITLRDACISIKKIVEEQQIGLEVWDGNDWTKILAAVENGTKEIYTIETNYGSYLGLTLDHKVYASEDMVNWKFEDTQNIVGKYIKKSLIDKPEQIEKVISISFSHCEKVYDIQTSSSQFTANGIIVHNCHIVEIKDNLLGQNGIYDQLTTEAKIFRSGAGVGTSFSPLRSKYEILSGGGVSSGCLSFLKIFDRSADSVKSGGINRRSAKMIVLDINHPEIEEFIDWKYKEEQKVASLITGSKNNKRILKTFAKLYDEHRDINHPEIQRVLIEAKKYNIEINYIYRTMAMVEQGREIDFIELDNDFNNEAYHTVSGQNGNNSIAITDDFLQAVKLNKQWNLTARTTGETIKTVNAKDLWDKIAEAAWACADPGIQFKDTINAWNTAKTDGEIVASNPCSEYFFLNSTSCNLASLRLTKYYNFNNKEFDVKKFVHSVKLLALALEATVNAAILPTEELAMGSYKYRNLGIGYCDIGSLIMSCGYPYDSKEARGLIGGITALMTGITYQTSIEMASELGPFSRYEANKEHLLRVIRNHRAAVYNDFDAYDGLNTDIYGLNSDYVDKNIMNACKRIWDNVLENGEKYGFRNAHVTVLQPTGTSGLQLDADTTGIEPDFSLIKYKKLAGSGFFKIINSSVNRALNSLGYSEEQIKEVIHYILGHNEWSIFQFINTQQLIEKGFTKEIIAKIENNLKATTNIQYAFNKFTIGEDFCIDELGIDEEILSHPDFSILHYLGFSDDEIEEANKYTCGMQTIEGAPYVKEEHYDVFDCASRCGPYGTRYIKHRAHIKAVASAQPFLSGSISKTINLPREATIQDVQECYDFAHSIGVKCMALYRDGSKLSQPLSSGGKADDYADLILNTDILDEFSDSLLNQENLLKNIMYEPVRRRLPERRIGYTDEFVIDSHKFYLRTSEYPVNGDPVDKSKLLGEIFIDYGEEAPFARTALGLVARFASIGLQYGVPLEEYVEALCGIIQEPRGLVKHQNVKMGKSIFDVIGKILDYRYLENSDAVEVTDEELLESGGIIAMDIHNLISQHSENIPESITEKHVAKLVSDKKREKKERLVLENCPRCGSMNVIQKSSCTKECRDCGHKHGSCGD